MAKIKKKATQIEYPNSHIVKKSNWLKHLKQFVNTRLTKQQLNSICFLIIPTTHQKKKQNKQLTFKK